VTYIQTGRVVALGNERGSTIVFVSLAMVALLSMVALAVDVGMLFTARGEAQRAADAAALAGAGEFITTGPGANLETEIRNEAVAYAAQHMIRGDAVVIDPDDDVEIDFDAQTVRVTVPRTAARGNPVLTWFANVFGIGAADVSAVATAEVVVANAADCVKPFTVPDAWADFGGLAADEPEYEPGEGDFYDPEETGYGSDYRNDMQNGIDLPDNEIDPVGTTYEYDFGRPLVLKEGTPQDATVSSWYFPWDVPQAQGSPATGADRYRWNIANCNPNPIIIGVEYDVENGNMPGPTRQGVRDLIALDPDAEWDLACDCVINSDYEPWHASPRVGTIPLYNPTDPIDPGKKPIVFNNLTLFFFDRLNGSDVVGRFMFSNGFFVPGVPGPGGGQGNQNLAVHLIE
jgi:hypothetical protein